MNSIVITMGDNYTFVAPDGDEDHGFLVDNKKLFLKNTNNNECEITFTVTVKDVLIEGPQAE